MRGGEAAGQAEAVELCNWCSAIVVAVESMLLQLPDYEYKLIGCFVYVCVVRTIRASPQIDDGNEYEARVRDRRKHKQVVRWCCVPTTLGCCPNYEY